MKGYAPRRTYSRELTLLPSVYAQFAGAPIPDLHDWVTGAKRGPLLVVGSGGALAVARLTADLHEIGTGRPAKALTPSELTTAPQDPSSSLLLLSAGARHPDVLAAARIATSRGYRSIALLTLRPPAELPGALLRPDVRPIALPSQPGREGFLATTSVLSMAVALARAYAELDQSLPKYLSLLQEPMDRQTGPVSLVLTGPGHSCAGVDFETRMSELGLSHVQLTDYRNFAHGRHAGFNRNIETTTVVAFVAPKYRELAEATLAQLPKDANLLKIETNELWPVSALELIVGSMHITGSTARAAGIEPSRPGVPSFGRRLYHLRDPGSPPTRGIGPVERKVLACGSSIDDLDLLEGYAAAFERWKASLRKISFRGIVLDYDGTCCETSHRFDLTPEPVRVVLTRLLESDAILGFASGRGASLHRDLRKWIPKPHWREIVLGLYNGALVLTLDDEVPNQSDCSGDLNEAATRLEDGPLGNQIKVDRRKSQVTVEVPTGSRIDGKALAIAIAESISRAPKLDLKVVASAHSADIVSTNTTKAAVLEAVSSRVGGEVLAIGDQGQVGGNDFELLAATPHSLSVDHCSADPTRCWNLGRAGEGGTSLLVRYLEALTAASAGVRFSLPFSSKQYNLKNPKMGGHDG